MAWSRQLESNNFQSFYILLDSGESKEIFPQNNKHSFRNKFNKEYNLNENWTVALCDFQFFIGSEEGIKQNNINVYCNIITETQIGYSDKQLLRRVPIRESDLSRGWLLTNIINPYYLTIKSTVISEIGITIDTSPTEIELQQDSEKETSLLLHFNKKI